MISDSKKIQHLFWRGAFGISYGDLMERDKKSLEANVEALFSESEKFSELDGLQYEIDQRVFRMLSGDEKKKMRQEFFSNVKSLNLLWLQKISNDAAQLREKM